MAEGFRIATAYVEVSPDTEGFREQAASRPGDAAVAGVHGDVGVGLDDSDLNAKLDDIRARIDDLAATEVYRRSGWMPTSLSHAPTTSTRSWTTSTTGMLTRRSGWTSPTSTRRSLRRTPNWTRWKRVPPRSSSVPTGGGGGAGSEWWRRQCLWRGRWWRRGHGLHGPARARRRGGTARRRPGSHRPWACSARPGSVRSAASSLPCRRTRRASRNSAELGSERAT